VEPAPWRQGWLGFVAAELTQWLGERELNLAATTLSNYRNAVQEYIVPFLGGRQLYTLDKRYP
jgi:hypothetical protein